MWIPLDQIEVGVRYFVELGAWVRAIGVWWGCGQRGSGVMVGGGGRVRIRPKQEMDRNVLLSITHSINYI